MRALCYGTVQTSIYHQASQQSRRQAESGADLLDKQTSFHTIASEEYGIVGFAQSKQLKWFP